MKIGIDIDNTITDTLPILKQYCKKYNEEVVKRNLKENEEGYTSYTLYDWTKEENDGFCENYLPEAMKQVKTKRGAVEIIQKLKEKNDIYIITARSEKRYEMTRVFLQANHIPYDNLMIDCKNKAEVCKKNGIEVMIEDEPPHIESISNCIPVIVFEEPYNKNCKGDNVYKVKSWNEVYPIIENIEKGR